ncbi:alpha/beta hydrolase [Fulvivirga ligni]|uniref:alpha/beta hydrolase n=1 Tax=Fulvivirga ligni TaxID=2904246 RepID=UPI001F1C9CA7|nr:alpha/beta fold hydrolase [Fulvivirga ligni]UII24059.1 alpha/beta fold hydrolase [Fulvivirga ligni]
MIKLCLSLIVCLQLVLNYHQVIGHPQESIHFKSADGVDITADLYIAHEKTAPLIILFHQAGWSRGEYLEVAPRFNEMGFNCIAVDLRSGGSINDVQNATNQNALKELKATQYADAYKDMVAAIDYAKTNYGRGKIIALGSSYSSALALKLAGDMPEKVDAVIAFSPAEYFTAQGKPRDYITSSAVKIMQPVFITSAKSEKNNWWGIYVAIPSEKKQFFMPETTGNHGAKALWSKYKDSKDYWSAVKTFLDTI